MKRRKINWFKISVFLVILTVFWVGAKYLINHHNDLVYGGKAFYFNSDLLKLSSKSYTLQNGTDEISVNLYNYEDKLRVSLVDIEYEVVLLDSNSNEVSKKSGVLSKNKKSTALVTFDNLDSGSYTVNAISKRPYYQILTSTFHVQGVLDDIEYSVTDSKNSQIVQLTINTYDYSGNLNITFPSDVIVDNTNTYFRDYSKNSNGNSYTVNFKNNSEYTFKFFKSDPSKVYTKSNFSVSK